jgi:hypothetical protein
MWETTFLVSGKVDISMISARDAHCSGGCVAELICKLPPKDA